MRAMTEVAQQRAVAPLGKIILRPRQAIIEPQARAPELERTGDFRPTRLRAADNTPTRSRPPIRPPPPRARRSSRARRAPAAPRRPDEAAVARLRRPPTPRSASDASGSATTGSASSTSLARMTPSKLSVGGAVEPLRRAPADAAPAPASVRRCRSRKSALISRMQIALAAIAPSAIEPRQDVGREAAAARADLQYRSRADLRQHVGALLRDAGAEQR